MMMMMILIYDLDDQITVSGFQYTALNEQKKAGGQIENEGGRERGERAGEREGGKEIE